MIAQIKNKNKNKSKKTRSRTCKHTKYTMKGSSNIEKNKAIKIKYTTRNKQEK